MRVEPSGAEVSHSNIRRWPRYKVDVPIRAILHREDRVVIAQGRGNELNEGGMTVFAGLELKLGAALEIEFTPPYQGVPLRVRCVVRNRTGYRYGVEFLSANAEEERKISLIRSALQTLGSPVT